MSVSAFFVFWLKLLGFFLAVSHFRQLVRIPVVVLLSLVVSLPIAVAQGAFAVTSPLQFPISFISGVLISLPFVFALETIAASARMVDLFRGAQFGEQMSAITGSPSSILENFFIVVGICAFFLLDFHQVAFLYLSDFDTQLLLTASTGQLLNQSAQIFYLALILSAPVLVVVLVIDLFSSVLSKALPQVSIVFEILPLKLTVCLAVLALAIELDYFAWPIALLMESFLYAR